MLRAGPGIIVIRPEQLGQALDRIDPRDRELLSLSLRRRVPDEAVARLYDCEPADVARRRARAIERLADEMELQRGEDLGAVLKALLEPETWGAVAGTLGAEFAMGAGGGRLAAAPPPPDEEVKPTGPVLAPVPAPDEDATNAEPPPPKPARPEPPPQPAANEPVLEMLAAREREVRDAPRRAVPLALIGLGLASLVGAAGIIGATQFGESSRVVQPGGDDDDDTRPFIPAEGGPLAAPFPTEPRTISCYSTAFVRRATVLYREPGGSRRLRITPRTEWGSPRVLGVLEQRGNWLGVQAAELRNGEIAWVPRERARVDCVRWSLHADLSKRMLLVRRDGRTVRKMRVAIGRRENPTPRGRFTVTDKLRVTDGDSPYGCCVLALSGHQTNLPDSWPGGDRLAVHATSDESSIGRPVSLGCLRAEARRARWLIETVPLGAPIFIRV
jgi:L,D-transpeptidase-like protein